MTIISITICSQTSKIVFARQFTEINRKSLEEIIVEFSRMITLNKEVSCFESDKNRFLYNCSDQLYLVVITTLDSNIINDMEILKTSNRIIYDICGITRLDETSIVENAFEIALALDDLVTIGGYDGMSMLQLKNYLKMDSAEEKEFKKIQQQREKHAQEQLYIKMKEIEAMKKNKGYFNDSISNDTIHCGSDIIERKKSEIKPIEEDYKSTQNNTNSKVTSNLKPKTKGLTLGKKKENGKFLLFSY